MIEWPAPNLVPNHASAETLRWVVRELRRHLQCTGQGDARMHLGSMIRQCRTPGIVQPDIAAHIYTTCPICFEWKTGQRVEITEGHAWLRRDVFGAHVECVRPQQLRAWLDELADRSQE